MFDYHLKSLSPQGWQPCTRELFDRIVALPEVLRTCDELSDLAVQRYYSGQISAKEYAERKSKLKKRLPAFAFHAHFPDGRRKNKGAIPSGLALVDIDGCDHPQRLWERIKEPLFELTGEVLLAHKTPSGRGLRLVMRLSDALRRQHSPEAAIACTQQHVREWLTDELGKDPGVDMACKDLARISFAVPESYIYYRDDRLFESEELRVKSPCRLWAIACGGAMGSEGETAGLGSCRRRRGTARGYVELAPTRRWALSL